ncbi:MAG: PAS domain-containing protein [Planctomycetes bacterium]|nr:PAS domain-containing protein [Planctomycetota bacterium]
MSGREGSAPSLGPAASEPNPHPPAAAAQDSVPHPARSFIELHEIEYRQLVQWFLLARVLIAVACLFALLVYEEGEPVRFTAAYTLLVGAVAFTTAHLVVVSRAARLDNWVVVAVAMDILLETLLVYLTGGIGSLVFSLLFFGSILSAVLLISERAGFVVAATGIVSLVVTSLLYWLAVNSSLWGDPSTGFSLPLVPKEFYAETVSLRWGRLVANLLGLGFAFFGVAFLAGRLPHRLSAVQILYEELIERMGEGVVALDRRGVILIANAEMRRLLNWRHDSALAGSHFDSVLRRREDRLVLDVLARGEDQAVELELTIRGRGKIAVEARTSVLRDQRGRVRGVVGIFRDQSLQRQLAETQHRLARLADTEAMALGIAHEIRNPLGSIRGAIQELADHAFTDPSDQRLAEIVREESERLDRILQQFLDFARMRPPLQQEVSLDQLLIETVELLARRSEAEDVELICDCDWPARVEADPDQLRQAVLNVALNGLEALEGKGRLRISLERGEIRALREIEGGAILTPTAAAVIVIENDGPPVSAETQAQIFTPFFTTKRAGLGLGMAITQKILRAHSGDVALDESPLGGARFQLTLPLLFAPE